MKAVKITKIIWKLDDLEPAERGKAKAVLPTSKGFLASDDFEVAEKVPGLLKKKFGYDIVNFSFTEVHISETIEALMKAFGPKEEKKPLYNTKGELSSYGSICYSNLIDAIARRKEMEAKGTPYEEIPKMLDKLMFSLEKITGMDWNDTTVEEFTKEIDNLIKGVAKKFIMSAEEKKLMRKEARKSLKDEMKKMDDEGDSEFDPDDEKYDE